MDFSALKNRSAAATTTFEAAKKLNAKAEFEDNDSTFWSPQRGKDGNGFAIIRFLPPPAVDGDDGQPFVKYFRHSFEAPVSGEWYIENCLTTFNRKDPVNDLTRILYKSGTEHDKALAIKYKRKATYVTNILVIQDDLNPANNGQLKKFRFGVKVWEKIESAMFPKIGQPIDPFDFWKGANFGLVTKTVGDYANYDDSRFDIPSALSTDEAYLEKLWRESYSLKAFLDEKNYKDYDTLKEKLDKVLGFSYEERGSAASHREPAASPLRQVITPAAVVATAASPASTGFSSAPLQTVTTSIVAPIADDDEELAALKAMAAAK